MSITAALGTRPLHVLALEQFIHCLKPYMCWRCLGQPLALQMQLAAVAVLCARFRFEFAERMGGPEGVGNSSINRLTLQPKVSCRVGVQLQCLCVSLMPGAPSPYILSPLHRFLGLEVTYGTVLPTHVHQIISIFSPGLKLRWSVLT